MDFAFPAHFRFAPFRKGIGDRNADSVQPSADLIGFVVEFAARVQRGHHHFQRRLFLFLVKIHRNASAVIGHGNAAVRVNNNVDFRCVSGKGLVDRIVHHFINKVMEPARGGVPDIHGRPFPYGLNAFQNLNGGGVVLFARLRLCLFGFFLLFFRFFHHCHSPQLLRLLAVKFRLL